MLERISSEELLARHARRASPELARVAFFSGRLASYANIGIAQLVLRGGAQEVGQLVACFACFACASHQILSRPFRDDAGQATSAERQHNEHLCFATAVLYALRHLMPAPLARVLRPLAASKRHKDALLRHARVCSLIIALHNNPSARTTQRRSISGPSTCSPQTGYEHDE